MASEQHVKQYLAYWVQLGKRVIVHNGQKAILPKTIIAGDRYSQEFEDLWNFTRSSASGDCYIEGTEQTFSELLRPDWEINPCSRCAMPVPTRTIGLPPESCPCFDLPHWPNTEMPQPREPVSSQASLSNIRDRLRSHS
ncbi:hypothetical protein [Myxacorys almedinensis]|uniref:Uncharacterized protein n=1 Tax=Myxacorys almedinensis A TaxID=2690445 RepID=A0A8J7Z3Z6_9CYAN|nr:hypothetical protein [Myxacorys almedinensis]NDJ19552.1 hypothetical protein [Myxacorys almedinensis A]